MKKRFYLQISQIKRIKKEKKRRIFSHEGTLELARGALTIKDEP
jgi:hypothetical protein